AGGRAGTGPRHQPVIWTSARGASWATGPGSGPLTATGTSLTAAAAGPAGYVVTGSTLAGGKPAPAAWFSADLNTWARASLTGTGTSGQLLAVTAARSGFVAEGAGGGLPAPRDPARRAGLGAPAARPPSRGARAALTGTGTSGQLLAVTAARSGFVAVGAAGSSPALWTSPGGSAWRLRALPRPPGAASAVLTRVTATGAKVVATGYESRGVA